MSKKLYEFNRYWTAYLQRLKRLLERSCYSESQAIKIVFYLLILFDFRMEYKPRFFNTIIQHINSQINWSQNNCSLQDFTIHSTSHHGFNVHKHIYAVRGRSYERSLKTSAHDSWKSNVWLKLLMKRISFTNSHHIIFS